MSLARRNQELARRYAESKESVAQIAADFRLTERTVRTIASALGQSRDAAIDVRHKEIAAAIASGRKGTEVAKAFGVSANWARKIAKEINGGDTCLTGLAKPNML